MCRIKIRAACTTAGIYVQNPPIKAGLLIFVNMQKRVRSEVTLSRLNTDHSNKVNLPISLSDVSVSLELKVRAGEEKNSIYFCAIQLYKSLD